MVVASKDLMAVCRWLYEAKELPVETPIDILTGLTICSVSEFKSLHEHCLQEQKWLALTQSTHPSVDDAFKQVISIITTAVQYYDSLNVSTCWNLPRNCVAVFGTPHDKKENTCWNCGKAGCHPDRCPQPCNEQKIADARRKWNEAWKKLQKKGKLDGKCDGKQRETTLLGNYEQDKWTPPSMGQPAV